MADKIRLQKFLADAGICSRRKAEELISAGQVYVNGEVMRELGTKVDPESDTVHLGKKLIKLPAGKGVTIVLNKPRGYIVSTSSKQGKTVYDLIPEYHPRLLPVGRLDKDSEGVLLMTNRNELISELTHPRNQHKKVYEVTVSGDWNAAKLKKLNSPMKIDDQTMSANVRELRKGKTQDRRVLEFTLTEGKNRQIRKMCESVSLRVHRLFRTEFAGLTCKGGDVGKWRQLTARENERLSAGIDV